MMDVENKQDIAVSWFRDLRDKICLEFIAIEREYGALYSDFMREYWDRPGGGGGEISVMYGKVFEKVGVNISVVYGQFSDDFAKKIPGSYKNKKFWASGISLVAHMHSPIVPAIHMNTRFICTDKQWFGGGMDITPMYYNEGDDKFFHSKLEAVCNKFGADYYAKFKQNADEYFYLAHRKESRGIGGIFYDYLDSDNWDDDFAYTQAVGRAFLDIYPHIVRKHMYTQWTDEQREYQLFKRGRYVEFNLLYDRGTRFGLMTGGYSDAIMMSMPPKVKWGVSI